MKRTTIFSQLIIRLIPAVVIIITIISVINYYFNKDSKEKQHVAEKVLITQTIKNLLSFRDMTFEAIESRQDARMRGLSKQIVNEYLPKIEDPENYDLNIIREALNFDLAKEDLYFIDTNGVVVNTTFADDINLNFTDFGEKYVDFFDQLREDGVFKRDRLSRESATNKARIYSYQPSLDNKYIVELGFYTEELVRIDSVFLAKINKLSEGSKNIQSVRLYIASPEMYAFADTIKPPENHHDIFRKTFTQREQFTIAETTPDDELVYDYVYLEMQNAALYEGYVVQIISSQKPLNEAIRKELSKQSTIYLIGIIIISFLIYLTARKISLPITTLIGKVKQISENNLNERVAIKGSNEVAELSQNFNLMIEKLQKSYSELEQKVIERTKKLSEQTEKLKENTKLKEMFVANTSHEIRTPLNGILGYANLLINTELNEKQKTYLNNIRAAGDNLLVVINDILDFSKIEAGKLIIEAIDFNFRNVISNLFNTMILKAHEKNINLRHKIDEKIPSVIKGDPVRLHQILGNLIGNAIKFTPHGGTVELLINLQNFDKDITTIHFTVSDTGIGIPSDKLDLIFESFTQARSETTRKYGGTGLGLAIVFQLVKLHNGEISVKSDVNEGTSFYFYLKYKTSELKDLDKIKIKNKLEVPAKLNKARILLVEDYPLNQSLTIDTINDYNSNIAIDLAENGIEAIEKIEEVDYDLVIMDIQMPEMDGYEATKHIRNVMKGTKSSVPILGMSAHAMKTEKDKCLALGMNDYLVKPFVPEDLFRKIEKLTLNLQGVEVPQKHEENNILSKKNYKFIDLSYLPSIYQKNEQKRRNIIQMTLDNVDKDFERLKKHFANREYQRVKEIAHTLKNSMHYIGMMDAKEMFIEIEKQALKNDKSGKIFEHILKIESLWKYARKELVMALQKI